MVRSGLPSPGQFLKELALAFTVTVAVLASGTAWARDAGDHEGVASLPYLSLPAQARQVEQAIRQGGPFTYDKDGGVFSNRERHLPAQYRGYYREYTVDTPGARNRGARRIVCGGAEPRKPDVCYYTADHYNSFSRIVN